MEFGAHSEPHTIHRRAGLARSVDTDFLAWSRICRGTTVSSGGGCFLRFRAPTPTSVNQYNANRALRSARHTLGGAVEP